MNNTPHESRRLKRLAAEEEYRRKMSHSALPENESDDLDLPDDDGDTTAIEAVNYDDSLNSDYEQDASDSSDYEQDADSDENEDYSNADESESIEDNNDSSSKSTLENLDDDSNKRPIGGSRTVEKETVEKGVDPKKSSSKKKLALGIGSGVLILLLTGGGIGYTAYENSKNAEDVPKASQNISNVSDISKSCDPFTKLEIKCSAVAEPNDNVKRNELVSQSIKAGTEIDRRDDNSIKLVYSKGPKASIMPNVTRMTVDDATRELESKGLIIDEIKTVDSPDFEKSRIVKTSIDPNAPIKNGQKVSLEVASGSVTLPDWKGKTKEEVDASARNLGLTVNYTEEESEQAPGVVISQTPAAKQQSDGDKVTVVLSKQAAAKDVAIPDVVGMDQNQAQTELASAGFRKISTAVVENNAVSKPQVTQVIPGPGTNTKTTDQIVIIVSTPASSAQPADPSASSSAPAPSPSNGN